MCLNKKHIYLSLRKQQKLPKLKSKEKKTGDKKYRRPRNSETTIKGVTKKKYTMNSRETTKHTHTNKNTEV